MHETGRCGPCLVCLLLIGLKFASPIVRVARAPQHDPSGRYGRLVHRPSRSRETETSTGPDSSSKKQGSAGTVCRRWYHRPPGPGNTGALFAVTGSISCRSHVSRIESSTRPGEKVACNQGRMRDDRGPEYDTGFMHAVSGFSPTEGKKTPAQRDGVPGLGAGISGCAQLRDRGHFTRPGKSARFAFHTATACPASCDSSGG